MGKYNSGDGPTNEIQTAKRKRVTEKTRGNRPTADNKRKNKRRKQAKSESQAPKSDTMKILMDQKEACISKGCQLYFLSFFCDGDGNFKYNEAVKEFEDLRSLTTGLKKDDYDQECLSLFLRLHETQYENIGEKKWSSDINKLILVINGREERVCLKSFVEAHGFTLTRWNKCAELARSMSNKGLDIRLSNTVFESKSAKMKRFTDESIPNFTLVEANKIFAENVPDFTTHMLRAALTPKVEADFLCTAWLFQYFDAYGDSSPTEEDLTKISVTYRNEVYSTYIQQLDRAEKKVSLTRFYELWSSLYPLSINRSWCSIPGKCDICYEIDKLRRTSSSISVQRALKEAHLLHRGGMFMLERYVNFHFAFCALFSYVLFVLQAGIQNPHLSSLVGQSK